jgi:hypothetical protein
MDASAFQEFPPAFLLMAEQNAARIATELREQLVSCGLAVVSPGGDAKLLCVPAQYQPVLLLELAAAIQIEHWEVQGLHSVLGPLPTFRDAVESIRNRFISCPASFLSLANAQLCHVVNNAFCSSLAWEAEPILGATVAVRIENLDSVLDAITELLWTERTR